MFVSLLRSLMANHHLDGGFLQDAELMALGDSLLKDAQCNLASCIFTVSFTNRVKEEALDRLERTLVLSDSQMGIEQPYIFWLLDLQSEHSGCIINWSTTRLLLCLVCAHLIDITTFGVALMEVGAIGGLDIIRDILNTPLTTDASPFLSIYAHSIALPCILLGFSGCYTQLFKDCIPLFESIKSEACTFTIHRTISSINLSVPFNTSVTKPRPLIISDIFQILLACKRMRRLANSNAPSCLFSDVRIATEKINNLISIELCAATALVELLSACITHDGLACLVANRGSHFCYLAADIDLPNQIKGQRSGTVSELSKQILDKFYAHNALEGLSAVTRRLYTKAYKRFLLIHVVFAYFDEWIHKDFSDLCADLIDSYGSSPSSLQQIISLCTEASGLTTSPLSSAGCYLAICVYALDHTWRSFRASSSFTLDANPQNSTHVTTAIKHVTYASKRHSKVMAMSLQDISTSRPHHSLLKQTVKAYSQLIQILIDFLTGFVDSSGDTVSKLWCSELFSTELLHTILSGIQSVYLLHCLENKSSTQQISSNSEACSNHDHSPASEAHVMIPLTIQLLLLLFRQHLYLNNTGVLQERESKAKSKLFACCFAFLFSLDTVLSIDNDNYVFLSCNEEHSTLLRSFVPATVSAFEAFLISLLPFTVVSFIPGTSVPSDFISLYLGQISQLYDGNPLIQSYYKLISRIADSCHTVAVLNPSLHTSRCMYTYIFFQRFLVQSCGEKHRFITAIISDLYMKEIDEGSTTLFCMFSSSYLPSLTANLYLPLAHTASSEKLTPLCVEGWVPVMMNYPRLSVEDFVIVTGALAILSCVDDTIASVLAYHASLENLVLSDTDLHNALITATMLLVVLYADSEVLASAKTLKKIETMVYPIDTITTLAASSICANIKPHKLFHEGLESGNGPATHISRLMSIIFILMAALLPLSKDVLYRIRLLNTLTGNKQKGFTAAEMPISILANLSNYTGFLFRILSFSRMKPLLNSICYREAYIDEESKAPDMIALWNRLKTMYLHTVMYGIRAPIVLESLLDYFGVFFYSVSTLAPDFLHAPLAVDLFLSLEEIIDVDLNHNIFNIYWLGYIRMLLEHSDGKVSHLVELIIDERRISEETKRIARLLVSIYRKDSEVRHTQLYSSVDSQLQETDDPATVVALIELLVDASCTQCEFLWRALVPLVIHTLSGLFVRSYLSLLISLLPPNTNLFDQKSLAHVTNRATPVAYLLLYIKTYQCRLENKKLKQSAKQVLKDYGTLLECWTLPGTTDYKYNLSESRKEYKDKAKGHSDKHLNDFINHIIEGGDLYAASCITELDEYFITIGESQRAIYISNKTYQRMQSFVETLPIIIRDTERKYLLNASLVVTSASSFFAIFIELVLKLLQEGTAQKNITLMPEAQKHVDHISNLWTIIEPYVAVSQAIGAIFYDALLSLLSEHSALRVLASDISRFLALFFAALITDRCKLIEYIESHFMSSLYATCVEGLCGTVPSSGKAGTSGEKDCIAELEREEVYMRDSLTADVSDLRKFVTMKQIVGLTAFHPYQLSKDTTELLHQVQISSEVAELDIISSFLIKMHFNKYFEEQEMSLCWQTLVTELSPETDRMLYMSRLDPTFEDSISLTRTIPKAAQKSNVDYVKFLSEHPMLFGNPLRAIMVAGVFWAADDSTFKETFIDILRYISLSYAAVFSICFLKEFKSDAFFSILTLLAEGTTGQLSSVNAERRNATVVLRTGVINKLIAGSAEQQKLIYNQDVNDTSSSAQLLDRFYGIGYALLGSLYAAASSYPLHDSFSIPQWKTRSSQEAAVTTTITIRNLLHQYSNMLLRVSLWTELTQFLREQDFFDQMLLALDQFPASTHAQLVTQLRRHKPLLFQHNCQFLYKRILTLACARYRECRYTDLSVRLLVHEFIDNNLFDFAEDTQGFIIDAMFGELMIDIDSIEGQSSSIVSMSTRCSFVGNMYSALATYAFILAIIHRMLFRRPSSVADSSNKADCWSRFYQKCLVTALSAWMLVACSLTKLLAYNAQLITDNDGKSKVSTSFLTSSLLYFAPATDFCLCMDKHQKMASKIIELAEDAINLNTDIVSDEKKGIPGVDAHVLNFLLALGLDTLVTEANEKLTEIIDGSPAILLQNQFHNICSIIMRLCDTKVSLIAIEYSSMLAETMKNHILNVIAKKLIPYPAHFDIAIRQFGVHMNNDYNLEEEALRQPVFSALVKRVFALLEAHEVYNPAYTRYIIFSTTMTNVLRYMQSEYTKKSLNTSKQCLLPHIMSGSFFMIPTLEAISSLKEFEYGMTTDKRSPHQIDNNTECISVLEHYYEYYSSRHAASYVTMVRHFSSKRAPLLFRMSRTKNDHGTRLILKCGEDTVADYAVMQFTEELAKCSANTFFKPYFVAVLINIPKNQVSIIEHIDGNVMPIDELLSPVFMGAKAKAAEFINEQEPDKDGCFPTFDLFTASVTALSHMQMVLSKTHPCRFIALSQKNQQKFATTLAHWCAVCIVTGLGDRHSCNILVDADDGSVHFIDFEAVFEYPKLLSYAELVPFRLTALITQLLGPTGVHGCFYWELVKMISLIQENAPIFINVFYPLAIVRASLGYVRQIKEMLETQRAEEIVNAALAQAADSSRLGCMFGGWMAFL